MNTRLLGEDVMIWFDYALIVIGALYTIGWVCLYVIWPKPDALRAYDKEEQL